MDEDLIENEYAVRRQGDRWVVEQWSRAKGWTVVAACSTADDAIELAFDLERARGRLQ
jgi:3-oxoacyl-(acyl-carrier-protein) synthase